MNAETRIAGQMLKALRERPAWMQADSLPQSSLRSARGSTFDFSSALRAVHALDTLIDRGIRELRSPLSD